MQDRYAGNNDEGKRSNCSSLLAGQEAKTKNKHKNRKSLQGCKGHSLTETEGACCCKHVGMWSSICTWLCPMTQQFHSLVPTLEYVLHMCPERPGPICLKKHCLYYQKLETNQKHSLKEDWRKKLWYIYMNEKERTTAMHTSVEEADRSHLEQ